MAGGIERVTCYSEGLRADFMGSRQVAVAFFHSSWSDVILPAYVSFSLISLRITYEVLNQAVPQVLNLLHGVELGMLGGSV